ncbi:MAG: trypsin-like peptidase domain-containing protein [Candidatus Promineifilaceae bacterium]|nr:trypsin-like peptidase domain-containing protein [Candidatus Promineifilaceae bacterium]
MNFKDKSTILIAVIILALASMACGLTSFIGSDDNANEGSATVAPPEVVQEAPASSEDAQAAVQQAEVVAAVQVGDMLELESRLVQLYQRTNPSVVHILIYRTRADDTPLGSGSGFVYDSDGHVVTNNHVIQDGNVIEIVFANGSRRRAEIVGTDVDSDLAVLKLESVPSGVQPLPLADFDQVQVGQLVIAIGNPFGEQGSMSMGIISGLGRSIESQRQLENSFTSYSLPGVVQTDAPINPGNSGGPLLNLDGEVIGVNSAIRSTTGVNSGVGFSIPVAAVHRIVPELIRNGEYTYSFMGVTIRSLNLNAQERLDLPQAAGAYVINVTEGGPADQAGLVPAGPNSLGGDLITAINGEPIQDTQELIGYLVFESEVDETIDLTVIRDGETITIPLTLGARP